MLDIEDRLQQIERRNARVEVDKAWEPSLTRRFLLLSVDTSPTAVPSMQELLLQKGTRRDLRSPILTVQVRMEFGVL